MSDDSSPMEQGPQPLRVEEVSRDGDTVTYGIFVNADQLANMYDGTDNDGTADVPGAGYLYETGIY